MIVENRIAIFASLTGSTVKPALEARLADLVISHNPEAGIIKLARSCQVAAVYIRDQQFDDQIQYWLTQFNITHLFISFWQRPLPSTVVDKYRKSIARTLPGPAHLLNVDLSGLKIVTASFERAKDDPNFRPGPCIYAIQSGGSLGELLRFAPLKVPNSGNLTEDELRYRIKSAERTQNLDFLLEVKRSGLMTSKLTQD